MSVPVERIQEVLQGLYDESKKGLYGHWPEQLPEWYEAFGEIKVLRQAAEELGVDIQEKVEAKVSET